MEIQAGLAKTQYGCLPMPPHSEWEWVEQYGPVQLDPALLKETHRRRYEAIEDQQAAEGAVEKMERLLEDTASMARRKARLVRPGSAAGALARRGGGQRPPGILLRGPERQRLGRLSGERRAPLPRP